MALEMYTNMLSLFFSETCVLTVVLDLAMQLECWVLMSSILEKVHEARCMNSSELETLFRCFHAVWTRGTQHCTLPIARRSMYTTQGL